jgi:hypothetical protein
MLVAKRWDGRSHSRQTGPFARCRRRPRISRAMPSGGVAARAAPSPPRRPARPADRQASVLVVGAAGCRDVLREPSRLSLQTLRQTGTTSLPTRLSRSRARRFWRWCGGTGLPSSPADICTKRGISPLRARAYIWSPASSFLVGAAQPEMPGEKRLGAVVYELGNATLTARIAEVSGLTQHWIDM